MNPAAEEFRPSSSTIPPPFPATPGRGGGGGGWSISGQPPPSIPFPGAPPVGVVASAPPVSYVNQGMYFSRSSPPTQKEKSKAKGKKPPARPTFDGQKSISKRDPFSPAAAIGGLRADANSFVPSAFPSSNPQFVNGSVSVIGSNSASMSMMAGAPAVAYSDPTAQHVFQPSSLLVSSPTPPYSSFHTTPIPPYNGCAPVNSSAAHAVAGGVQPVPPRPLAAHTYAPSASTEGENVDRLSFGDSSNLPMNPYPYHRLPHQQPLYLSSPPTVGDALAPAPVHSSPCTSSFTSPSTAPAESIVKGVEPVIPQEPTSDASPTPFTEDGTVFTSSAPERGGNGENPPPQQSSSPYIPPHLQPGSGGAGVSGGAMYIRPSSTKATTLPSTKYYANPTTALPSHHAAQKSTAPVHPNAHPQTLSEQSPASTPHENSASSPEGEESGTENTSSNGEERRSSPSSGETDGGSASISGPSAPPPEPKEEDLPVATAVSFAGSRLPKLFQCTETNMAAPATPIELSTAWELYADDHQTLLPELLSSMSNGSAGPPVMTHSTTDGPGAGGDRHSGDLAQLVFDPVRIATVKNLEEFWRLWRYVTPPSACSAPFTYSWFRENITPDWEHPRNRKGGTMSLYIFDRDRMGLNDRQNFDDVFLAVLLASVGESFAESASTVNGVMLKLRQSKPATLQIWTAHGDFNKLKIFAKSLRDILSPIIGEKPLQKIEFFLHPRNQPPQNSLAARLPKLSGPDHVL